MFILLRPKEVNLFVHVSDIRVRFGKVENVCMHDLRPAVLYCFFSSSSANHSGQRQGRRVSLWMNPSCVMPVLSS